MRLYLARSILHESQPLSCVTPSLTQTCAQQPAQSTSLGRQQVTLPSPSILNSFIFPPPTSFFFLVNPLFSSQWGHSFDDSSSLCHVPGCLSSRSSSTLMTRALLCSCCCSRTDVALIAALGGREAEPFAIQSTSSVVTLGSQLQ